MPANTPLIAAVVYPPTFDIGFFMRTVAAALAARGVRVGGVVQHDTRPDPAAPCMMELEDLESGARFALTQNLGTGSVACRLDTGALAQAAMAARTAIDGRAELILFNKFGALEAAGGGLRAEMGLAAAHGIPVLTAVAERLVADWQRFTGDPATVLPAELDAVLAWWQAVAPRRGN
jgi:hypothetical protein